MPDQTFTAGQILTAQQQTDLQTNIGLTFIKSQTIGTTVSSVTVTGAFSSSFDNYKITLNDTVLTNGGSGLNFVLGSSTPGSNYYWGAPVINVVAGTIAGGRGNNTGFVLMGTVTGSNAFNNSFDVLNPNKVKRTTIKDFIAYGEIGEIGFGAAIHNSDTAFTSFTFYTGAGTMTGGTIRVYGYRN
jgi:hypothetical protein